jgi:type IV pilus assembly protein PilM
MAGLLTGYFNIIKKLLPTEHISPSLGIDIGSAFFKAVVLRPTDYGYEVELPFIEALDPQDSKISLNRFKHELSTDVHEPYLAVGGRGSLIRHITMPKMSLADLRNSFSLEADKYFPFAQDQIYTDCFITHDDVQGSQMPVMAVAAKREMVDERMALMKSVDLSTGFIGLNAVAVANLIAHWGAHQGEPIRQSAFLDFGHTVTHLQIVQNNFPAFNRDILIGGKDLLKRLINAFGVEQQQAMDLMKDPGVSQDKAMSAYESVISNIAHEIKLSFDYFSTEKDLSIKTLYITGGCSLIPGIDKLLAEEIGVEVILWDYSDLLILPDDMDDQKKREFNAQFALAVGLALYRYD